jgi:hypothetical protein
MNAAKLSTIELTKGLGALSLSLVSGIVFGTMALADAIMPPANTPNNPPATIAPLRDSSNPAIEAANEKLKDTKAKLDQAHKQLEAAKAMVKAAEAEYKAARADKEALELRNEAQRLADASNAPEPVQNTDPNAIDLSNSRIEGYVPPIANSGAQAGINPVGSTAPIPNGANASGNGAGIP